MSHGTPLIATLVAGLGLAFILGAVAQRLRAPPLVAYLLAGIAVGPFMPGFVADQALAAELIGVILLMFGSHSSLPGLESAGTCFRPRAEISFPAVPFCRFC